MIILMMKMALYIIASVLFGYMVGMLYSNSKNRERYAEKERKQYKIISEKNAAIIRLKNDLRSTNRKMDAINQGYDLQSKLLATKERELEELLDLTEDYDQIKNDYSSLKVEHRIVSIDLSDKIKNVDDKDQVIRLLENKISQISKEKA